MEIFFSFPPLPQKVVVVVAVVVPLTHITCVCVCVLVASGLCYVSFPCFRKQSRFVLDTARKVDRWLTGGAGGLT